MPDAQALGLEVNTVTAELRGMSASELREGGARYQALLEARELEDAMREDGAQLGEDASTCSCIYGNPCAVSHCCRDWKNRFEVAKQHGWKGWS